MLNGARPWLMARRRDDDDEKPRSPIVEVIKDVASAGLTAAATGLVEWGIDELRERYGKAKKKDDDKPEEKKP